MLVEIFTIYFSITIVIECFGIAFMGFVGIDGALKFKYQFTKHQFYFLVLESSYFSQVIKFLMFKLPYAPFQSCAPIPFSLLKPSKLQFYQPSPPSL